MNCKSLFGAVFGLICGIASSLRSSQINRVKMIVASMFLISILSGCSGSGSDIKTDDPEKAFSIAKRRFDRGDYSDAIEDFSLLKVKFPGTSVSDKVQYYLGESYYRQGEYLLGAYEFETFLKSYPLSELVPEAKYKLGLCYYELSPKYTVDQQFTKYAVVELEAFIELFPTNKNVPDAEKKLLELKDKLAYKDFKAGELYMKMDNYRSAAFYFHNVTENYIESQWADDAMAGEIEALIAAKKNDEAKKVVERFYKLFPKSPLKSRVDRMAAGI